MQLVKFSFQTFDNDSPLRCTKLTRDVVFLKERDCDMMSVGSEKNLTARCCPQNFWDIQVLDASPDLF